MAERRLFTSESVGAGHPDKVADQISDAILDAMIEQDPASRVACETLVTTGLCLVAGEVTTQAYVDIPGVARGVIKSIGYTDAAMGFDYQTCAVLVSLDRQSPDISQGVSEGKGLHDEQGAGDQGMMFGYACDETPALMPMPIQFSHDLMRALQDVRQSGEIDYLRPDGKGQVTIEYDGHTPVRVHTVVISTQHKPDATHEQIVKDVTEKVIRRTLPADMLDDRTIIHVNPTGRFVVGGPQGDCGLTGRKIIVDTYGGMGAHGGGAFSGKDPSKVDRSAAYMARYAAKNLVAAGAARRIEVQLAYAIGVADPVSVLVDAQGTAAPGVTEARLAGVIRDIFPLKPRGIIDHLNLLRPIYRATAAGGHFGREDDAFTWEKTDKVDDVKKALGI